MSKTKRHIYFALGVLSLALGFAGIFLPMMPTAPFVIVAAFFFSKSSEKWNKWLHEHPKLGPPLKNWEEHRVIPIKAKLAATLGMCGSMAGTFFMDDVSNAVRIGLGVVFAAVLIFIWSCPSKVQNQSAN